MKEGYEELSDYSLLSVQIGQLKQLSLNNSHYFPVPLLLRPDQDEVHCR